MHFSSLVAQLITTKVYSAALSSTTVLSNESFCIAEGSYQLSITTLSFLSLCAETLVLPRFGRSSSLLHCTISVYMMELHFKQFILSYACCIAFQMRIRCRGKYYSNRQVFYMVLLNYNNIFFCPKKNPMRCPTRVYYHCSQANN